MSRVCTICACEHRDEIEDAFIAGTAKRRIATQYGVGEKAVRHHIREHLPALLVLARDAERAARADNLLDRIEYLHARIEAFLSRVEETEHHSATLGAFRELRANLELVGEITKELNRAPTLELHLNPEFMELRAVIIQALQPYPEARAGVVRALLGRGVENGRRS